MSTTTKASTSASTLTTSSAPETMYPPLLTLQNPLLGSIIPLPAETHVVYSIYTVTPSSQPDQAHTYIEQARRQILSHNASLTLLQSLLPSVHIDGNPPILYVFQVTCHDQIGECLQMMRGLTLEGLQGNYLFNSCNPGVSYFCALPILLSCTPVFCATAD